MRPGAGMGLAALAAVLGLAGPATSDAVEVERDWMAEGRETVLAAKRLPLRSGHARNVIVFIGDGMGLTTVTAARILEGQQRGESGEENHLAFETLPHVALIKTYNTNQQTPDSAGTMTAMMTGVKTSAGMIGVDASVRRGDAAGVAGHELRTLFEIAEERGLATGVVTTATVTHATPAGCYAHSPERGWENDSRLSSEARSMGFADIARQLVAFSKGDGLDVVLGGGRTHFLPANARDPEYPERHGSRIDGRDLVAEWTRRTPKARYVWNREQFEALDPDGTAQLLGLFEPGHMQFEADRSKDRAGEPSLSEMTGRAIELLSRNDRGYVLMVEGGRIDHAHHVTNAHRALIDTIELSHAVRRALQHVDLSDTLIVVTADHGHVFTIAGYPTRGNPILGLVVENDPGGEPRTTPALDALGRPYTTLGYQNGPGYSGASESQPEGPKHLPADGRLRDRKGIQNGRSDLSDVDTSDIDYLQEATVPLVMETHSGEDVPLYAGGPGAHLFHGVQEQSVVYHVIVEALGWNEPTEGSTKPPDGP